MNKQELLAFICNMLHIEECTPLILKQIHKNVTERGYDYIDIARALSYFVDVQGNRPQPQFGIGIVPFIMEDSKKYFENLRKQKEAQREAAKRSKSNANCQVIHCVLTKGTSRRKQIDIEDL